MTQIELRAFVYGIIAGILILIGTFVAVCEFSGVRFQPVVAAVRQS